VPVAVAGGHTFVSLTANGGDHTCGLAMGGAVYCWGADYDGQLGNGAGGTVRCFFTLHCSRVPLAVAGGLTFTSVRAGGTSTCGTTQAMALYCWGGNGAGELGIGNATGPKICDLGASLQQPVYACSPTPVAVRSDLRFISFSVGIAHTCAIASTSATYCWGGNYSGQLGINDPVSIWPRARLVVALPAGS
jgi:alpha-tubulin suppressor-like RCC1 family protein